MLVLATLRPSPTNRGRYLHWNELRCMQAQNGLSPEDHWLIVRFARRASSRPLPFADVKGTPFTLSHVPALSELLHEVDRDAAGAIDAIPGVANLQSRDRCLMTSLFEEAITSASSKAHRRSHAVAYDTARRDLLELVKEGLLMMHKEGKKFVFTPAGELARRVRG